jgi:hypothetical protein
MNSKENKGKKVMQLYMYDLIEKKRQVTEAKFQQYFKTHGR